MSVDLVGTWQLLAWRRIADDGTVTHPLGEDARGLLIYAPDGRMAVHLEAAGRPTLDTNDPLSGDVEQRAAAYSTCLAYAGSYEVQGETVIHRVDVSLYPNWSRQEQSRPLSFENGELVLRTPPTPTAHGTVVNEIAWTRDESHG